MLETGFDGLHEKCQLTPGIPVNPMLAKPTKGVSEVLDRFENIKFTCEFKYDGERAQIHRLADGTVKIFSRSLEDNTQRWPDVIQGLPTAIKSGVTTCVLDAEVVAWDVEKKCLLPFQVLSTRKRKVDKDAKVEDMKVKVIVMAFDLLYLNDRSYLKEPLMVRRQTMKANFTEVEGNFMFAVSKEGDQLEALEVFLQESIKGNCEGLMVKTLETDATYEPSKRSLNWLKLKKDYIDGMGDSLDLVPIAGFWGRGKRTGTYGAYLLACYDPETEQFQTVCKIGTGFSDENLTEHTEFFKDHVMAAKPSNYLVHESLKPDSWFDAKQVWEVRAADLSISPVHKGGIGKVSKGKGIGLRFPRYLRLRDDKPVENATSAEQVADMYSSQDNIVKGDAEDEDEFEGI
jgi:DNA ligase-1